MTISITDTAARPSTGLTHPLALALGGLILTDLTGGVLAVANGVNTWAEAWGPEALLAAPLPMVLGQLILTAWSLRLRSRWSALPAALLAVACLVSVASGFFDGGLANDALAPWLVAFQAFLLAMTLLVGVLAARQAWQVILRRA